MRLTGIMANLLGATTMTWQDDAGCWHAEVTTDEGPTRAKAHARGAIKNERIKLGTWDYQPITRETDSRTTETTTYWVEAS